MDQITHPGRSAQKVIKPVRSGQLTTSGPSVGSCCFVRFRVASWIVRLGIPAIRSTKPHEASRKDTNQAFLCKAHRGRNERGFTLLETTIALFIMTIVGLGAASLFAFSITNNSGAADRTQALALAQQQLERIRNARFSAIDSESDSTWILRAGARTQTGVIAGSRSYNITTTITNTTTTLKTITISVTPQGAGPRWATGAASTIAIATQRAKTR